MNILVIGGGVIGVSCAIELHNRGHTVTIYDPDGFGRGASFGNAGVIAVTEYGPIATPELIRSIPSLLISKNTPITLRATYLPQMLPWLIKFAKSANKKQVAHACEALSSLLLAAAEAHYKIAQAAGVQGMIEPNGWYKAFETDTGYAAARAGFEMAANYGIEYEYLSQDEFYAREPNLISGGMRFKHAVYSPQCPQIRNPGRYVELLGEYFLKQGGRLEIAEISKLVMNDGVITHALSGAHMIDADAFVIAAGAWSRRLAAECGSDIPLDTERGYHMEIEADASKLASAPILWGEHSIVMSPRDDSLRVTSSVEFAGLHAKPRYALVTKHESAVRSLYGENLGQMQSKWLGFRPSMPDSLPVISKSKADNAFLAFGHGHLGLTLGPITGRLIADLLCGNAPSFDLSPFSANRF